MWMFSMDCWAAPCMFLFKSRLWVMQSSYVDSCCCIHNGRLGDTGDDVYTAYPKKYAHGFFVCCSVVVMQSFIMNSHEVFIHIHQGCFAGIGAIVRLPQCQWSKPDGYGKISQCITTTKQSKAKTVCIFLGIYCTNVVIIWYGNDKTFYEWF